MNAYARLLLERHQPATASHEPSTRTIHWYTEMGAGIQHSITELRDQILGPQRRGENLRDYRQRSHQALRQAEEIVLAQVTEPTPPAQHWDREDGSAAQDLTLINDELSRLATDWTETAP